MLIGGGFLHKGKMTVFDRWDIREIEEGIILFWNDAFDLEKFRDDKLVLLFPTPCQGLN